MRALFRRCFGAGLVAGAALAAVAAPAQAQIDARRIVPLLRHPTRPHVLADMGGTIPMMVRMPPGVTPASRGLLPLGTELGGLRLTPHELETFVAKNPDLVPVVTPPRRPMMDVSNAWTRVREFRADTGLDGAGVVVGVIDTGLDVHHGDFRNADGTTRVAWLIRTGTPLGVNIDLEAAYGCTMPGQTPCGIYSAAQIDALLASSPDDAPRDPTGHGTHVASVAAGNGLSQLPKDPVYIGMAPRATIMMGVPTSGNGGFSDPDIVNHARFIFERAEEMGMPAVVNVSLGSDFGPHDGTSELERGLAELVGDDHPGRVLVVAAGNSGAVYQFGDEGPYGIHTEAHVSDSGVTRVPMVVAGLEGNVTGAGFVWITFRDGDGVSVGLEGPGGETWVSMVSPGDESGGGSGDEINAAIVNNRVGESSSINADTNSAVVAWDGTWEASEPVTILMRGSGDAQLWVTGIDGASPGPAIGLSFMRALKAGTVAVPASHPDLLAVGCSINRVAWRPLGGDGVLGLVSFGSVPDPQPDGTCYFSGAGPTPTGVMKPEIIAPGAYVAAAMSRDADPRIDPDSIFVQAGCPDPNKPCHIVTDFHALTTGTSMSAPHVAGAAALLLQQDPTLTQARVTELLQAGARYPGGFVPFAYQVGPGELDMGGTLQVLREQGGGTDPASPEASFFVMSAPYARPDPTWPLEGVIQIRHADGRVANGFAAQDITLHLTNGVVVREPARVEAGMWRFAVAAPEGSAGRRLVIDVRYRGQSIGAQQLPIGVDAWAAGRGVKAVGGCAVASAPTRRAPGDRTWLGALGWLGGLGVLARLRRRRSRRER